MKSIGMVRKVDTLGRLVIPTEIRKVFFLNSGDAVEFFIEGENIYLKKYVPGCVFCGDMNDMSMFKGLCICEKCKEELMDL